MSESPETTDAIHDSDEVETLTLGERRLVLVGTAHVSQESVALVRRVIEREKPDVVCVELDQRRFEALSQKKSWEGLDLREVIRKRQLATLMLNLFLASYQKRLGGKLGVMPGSELLEAIEVARASGVPVALCDRDVRVTLRRAWGALPLTKKALLVSGALASVGETPEISEEDLRRLKRKDVLSELMQELGQAMPELKRALIDERDSYLATKIARSEGKTVVAVVGAGHLSGMMAALRAGADANLEELERIPPVSLQVKALGASVSALFLGVIVYLGATRGLHAARDNALIWALGRAIPASIGGVIALGHPLAIIAAFLAAPFPIVGVGYTSALVQAYLVPPRVREFQTVSEDLNHVRAWWSNRLLRVFLVFIFTSLGRMLGTWLAGAKIVSNLLHP
ncbi:MAG: TraB/GumN family protein [Polyangiales bacterium]